MSEIRAIVNADDFGESDAITYGIAACLDAGTVTSTTILANMPGTELALRLAKERGRTSSFGVHLNLCEGPSLTAAPSLTDGSGRFVRKRAQALRAFAGRLDAGELERELGAQIARVRDAGVQISHLDGHKHLHQLPGVGAIVAQLAKRFGLERVRSTLEKGLWPRGIAAGAALSRITRTALARRFAPRLRAAGLRTPVRTLDLADVMRLPDAGARRALLADLPTMSEIFCHPGLAPEGSPPDARAERRLLEQRFLCGDDFRALASASGLRLVTYWEL